MKIQSLRLVLAFALFSASFGIGVHAVTVPNFSFENPAQTTGGATNGNLGNTTVVSNWTVEGANFGVLNGGGYTAPDGVQVAFTNVQGQEGILKTTIPVTTFAANTTYNLSVYVGNSSAGLANGGTYTVSILDNGAEASTVTLSGSSVVPGTFTQVTTSYTPVTTSVGHNLDIQLKYSGGSGGVQAEGVFDDVQLTTTAGTNPPGTSFTFTLPTDFTTTSGIYDSSGKLVRTLWRKVFYKAGAHTQTWDNNDDFGNPVPSGAYTIKVLCHNLHYVWNGVVGNTSASFDPAFCRHSFLPIFGMAAYGTDAFDTRSYNEGSLAMDRFSTTTPQVLAAQYGLVGEGVYAIDWNYVATDGTKVYYASSQMFDTAAQTLTKPGVVVAYNLSDNTNYAFSSGASFHDVPDWLFAQHPSLYWPNGVYVGTQPGLSGIAVQISGNYLAVSVSADNEIYLLDKNSGAVLSSFSVTNPQKIAFAPSGDLWVITGTSAVRYTNLSTTPTVATTISGFSEPLAIAVHPSNSDIVLIADGGTKQQVKGYTSTGAVATGWSSALGTLGGNKSAGPAVTNTKFWFTGGNNLLGFGGSGDFTYLTINTDGSFWLGDPGNNRSLHFSSAKAYLEQIAYLPDTLSCNVDANNSNRVFASFLEYQVDYTKPLLPGDPYATGGNKSWKLVNNWASGLSSSYFYYVDGPYSVATLSNGRTYCIAQNLVIQELTTTGMRSTGVTPTTNNFELQADGSIRYAVISGGTATFYTMPLTGFDGSNNPIYGAATVLASAPGGPDDPAPQGSGDGYRRFPITSSNIVVSFDDGTSNPDMHLGGITQGTAGYLWEAAPAGPLDFLGTYDLDAQYAGSVDIASGRSIIYGYNGEFGVGTESNQFMHYFDDGLFIGEFGTIGDTVNPTAGGAGNSFSPQFVATNGKKYMWHNDESGHGGLHRWELLGEDGVVEASGTGTTGTTISVTAPVTSYPANVVVLPGSGKAVLSWSAVAGASSYKVKYSTVRGGPYTTLASAVTAITYTKTGLANGTNYYFTVCATVGGVDSVNSNEVKVLPFDPTVLVQTAGILKGGFSSTNDIMPISSSNPANGVPAFPAIASDILGNLWQYSVGSQGYAIFNSNYNSGTGVWGDWVNFISPLSMTKNAGWSTGEFSGIGFTLDGTPESMDGGSAADTLAVTSGSSNTINITSPDGNWHVLTVFCPTWYSQEDNYTLTLTTTGTSTPAATYTENGTIYNWYQFFFKGNVTLTMNGNVVPTGPSGEIQAVFVDGLNIAATPVAPAGLAATAGTQQVSLTWTTVANATSYNIYRGTSAGGESTTAIATGVTLSTFTDTGLTTGTHYYYKIKAVNGVGTSGYSNETNAISL